MPPMKYTGAAPKSSVVTVSHELKTQGAPRGIILTYNVTHPCEITARSLRRTTRKRESFTSFKANEKSHANAMNTAAAAVKRGTATLRNVISRDSSSAVSDIAEISPAV